MIDGFCRPRPDISPYSHRYTPDLLCAQTAKRLIRANRINYHLLQPFSADSFGEANLLKVT